MGSNSEALVARHDRLSIHHFDYFFATNLLLAGEVR
jgi:hypothetical protein